jgi:hypothetical protein
MYGFFVLYLKIFYKSQLKMGRPPTRPARLKNGFYIEVKSQGSSAILIRRDTREQMVIAAEDYARSKNVTIKGEMLNDKWVPE